ncbi:hypothetical protein BGZ60DRAFT_405160 [Tricladium varicosporioides]|nr:hypothetical protein BGZ60DRAFT_405160 [Hymenoscyphus varicosporioides]
MGSGKPKAKTHNRDAKTSSKRKTRDKVAGLTNANFTPLPAKLQKPRVASENKSSVLHSSDHVASVQPSIVNVSIPFVKTANEALKHAKWPALLKKHMGVLESHIKTLDRMLQNITQFMESMPEDERRRWERGETGKFVVVAGSLDRVRDAYVCAKMVAEGVVGSNHLRDKKGLGVKGYKFEKLVPGILEKARAAGIQGEGLEQISIGRSLRAMGEASEYEAEDEDTEMEDVSDMDVESKSESSTTSASQSESKKASVSSDESAIPTHTKTTSVPGVEPNSYFINSNPTSATASTSASIPGKKRTVNGEHVKPVKKAKKERAGDFAPKDEATVKLTRVSKDKKRSSDNENEEKPSKITKEKSMTEATTTLEPPAVPAPTPTNFNIHPSRKRAIDFFEKQEEEKARRMKAVWPASTSSAPIPPPQPENSNSNLSKPDKKKRTVSKEEEVSPPPKKLKNSPEPETKPKGEDFDFVAYQKKLSGEIKSKEAAKAVRKEAKKDRKRRRSSDGVKREEKKFKK